MPAAAAPRASVDRGAFFPLFVPANRAERVGRAARSGADAVIVDLEDAVGEADKARAREQLPDALERLDAAVPVLIRVNGVGTRHFEPDLETVRGLGLGVAGIVLPKAEPAIGLDAIRSRIGDDRLLIGLVETPARPAGAHERPIGWRSARSILRRPSARPTSRRRC